MRMRWAFAVFAMALPNAGFPQEAIAELNDCMRKGLGDSGLIQMQKRSLDMAGKLEALCNHGQEAEAKRLALDFATTNHNSPEHNVVRACFDAYRAKYKGDTSPQRLPGTPEFAARAEHICEHIK